MLSLALLRKPIDLGLRPSDPPGLRYRARVINIVALLVIGVSVALIIPARLAGTFQVWLHAMRLAMAIVALWLNHRRHFGASALVLIGMAYVSISWLALISTYETIAPFTLMLVAVACAYILPRLWQAVAGMLVVLGTMFVLRSFQIQFQQGLSPTYSVALFAILLFFFLLLMLQRMEQEDAQRELTRSNAELRLAVQQKGEFVAVASHELRTPLTAIRGGLALISAGAVEPGSTKAGELLDIALNNVERLSRLVDDILEIEKIEYVQLDLEPVDLPALLGECVAAHESSAAVRAIRLRYQSPVDFPLVRVAPDRMRQIVENLLSNAYKFAPPETEVELSLEKSADAVRILVADRGPGVPEKFRQRLFQKFAQADHSDRRTPGGTGLGLAISRELARRHGGELLYRDREGGGAVFSVVLPADLAEPPERIK